MFKSNLTMPGANLIFQSKQKSSLLIVFFLTLLISLNIFLDFLFTRSENSSFYISESLLFSSFWVLFLPLLYILFRLIKIINSIAYGLLILTLIIALHLCAYSALVWVLSKSFYSNTYSFWQTFDFGLTAYLIKLIIIYGFSFSMRYMLKNNSINDSFVVEKDVRKPSFITSMIVPDSNTTNVVIQTDDVLHFCANSPYITIHHQFKRYLYAETLKSLETQLDDDKFVRIHKSYIVNLNKMVSYKSRQNGDYDLILSDGTILRVSRNYAKKFKSKLKKTHHLATK